MKDGHLHYSYNWLGEHVHKVASREPVPKGKHLLGVRVRVEGREGPSPVGMAALYVDGQAVAEGRITMQPGPFALAGAGITVGRGGAESVSPDYEAPFPFTGGTVKLVTIDVSGERYRDLERELAEAMSHD